LIRRIDSSSRRSKIEIVAEILRIARNGAKKTRIVYGANLNFKILEEYLARLEKAGLITLSRNTDSLIMTTKKGVEYLQQFHSLREFGID